jgi:hypothetical protein
MFYKYELAFYGVVMTAMLAAFAYHFKNPVITEQKPINHISVAINQKGELMIVDRAHGTYQVFSDTVGKAIYELYQKKDTK